MNERPFGAACAYRRSDLRWIQLRVIEQYARHCGPENPLRECIGETTGY